MMAELSPPGFDNMVRPRIIPSLDLDRPYHLTPSFQTKINAVLRFIRTLEPRIVDDRSERNPGDHQ